MRSPLLVILLIKGPSTTGVVREIMPVQADVKGRTLIMIEDIIDTGFTMQYVMDKLRKDGAADVKLATMLFKPDSLRCNLKPDYIGITDSQLILLSVTAWIMMKWGGLTEIYIR